MNLRFFAANARTCVCQQCRKKILVADSLRDSKTGELVCRRCAMNVLRENSAK